MPFDSLPGVLVQLMFVRDKPVDFKDWRGMKMQITLTLELSIIDDVLCGLCLCIRKR